MLASGASVTAQEKFAFLNCRRLPARLNTLETALLLGFQEHDITPLVAMKLLRPLGKPAPNSPKYFAAVDIMAAAVDRDWLATASRTVAKRWQDKNGRKCNLQILSSA
jgi:hypothetical protein